ncbi:Hypothetical_protein [Hexamita inflata]|uniref:Hypothetical_protein n=1 Tax=Hexamita inflata TaxID=28002 RepID=A0AA86V5L3_9EUKA|nr:Hypothetical protein HINF_LOCUS45153 [Hexamita inflata]
MLGTNMRRAFIELDELWGQAQASDYSTHSRRVWAFWFFRQAHGRPLSTNFVSQQAKEMRLKAKQNIELIFPVIRTFLKILTEIINAVISRYERQNMLIKFQISENENIIDSRVGFKIDQMCLNVLVVQFNMFVSTFQKAEQSIQTCILHQGITREIDFKVY